MPLRRLQAVFLLLVAAVLVLPVLSVLASWLQSTAASAQILGEMSRTVLPGYIWTTVWLCVSVGVGVAVVGTASAAAVTLFDFPGRRIFEWALLLPLAMPAYVVAYAYTDSLQFSGPLQTGIRALFGLEGRVLPEIRSLPGAVFVFIFSLSPYVYLLARAALGERAGHLMEAARLLGAPLRRRIARVALPLARPAVAAGVALALMETLADFGVSSYFGIQTFTTGIYKAWLAMDNRIAAAQLATLLLAVVAGLLALEARAQRRLRFSSARGGRAGSAEAQPVQLHGRQAALAWAVCVLPVLLGFVLPVLFMLRPLAAEWSVLPWDRFVQWSFNSVRLGAISATLAVGIALLLAFSLRRAPDAITRGIVQLASLGYAVPGAVIVVGLLLPVGWLQQAAPQTSVGYWITSTAIGVVWAYLVRVTGDRQMADDLLQEAFYRFLRAAATHESETHRRNSLYRIATNLARDARRRKLTHIPELIGGDAIERVGSGDHAESTERQTDVKRAMSRLKPRERAMLWLAYAEGASHREIADVLGVTPGSIKLLLFRARRRLAGLLGRKVGDGFDAGKGDR